MASDSRLARILRKLKADHGNPTRPPADPWHLILLENVAYLADDERRAQAFALLEQEVGLEPDDLDEAPDEVLREICAGTMPDNSVRKLRRCAEIARDAGDLAEVIRGPRARAVLKKFPGIADPGADKILLFCGIEPVLALESNGLRVLLRLGYGTESKSYPASYKSAQQAAAAELPRKAATLVEAHLLLRAHGRQVCRNKRPACRACPVSGDCPSARAD